MAEGAVECNVEVFATYIIMYTFFFAIFFICITNSRDIFVAILKRFTSRKEITEVTQENMEEISEDTLSEDSEVSDAPLSITAYVQLTILYFQVNKFNLIRFNFNLI